MAYTGYLVVQYIDDNPNSPTYGETWTEKSMDVETCPTEEGGEWIIISDTCEMDTSGYTGNRITIYYNSVKGEYSSTTVYDSSCIESSNDESWVSIGEECETDEDGKLTGYMIQTQRQVNRNLANYGQTREYKYLSPVCSAPEDKIARWQEISRICHILTDDCLLTMDGTADVTEIDVNPNSPTFNTTRTRNVEDENCPTCVETEFEYRTVGDFCGSDLIDSGFTASATTLYTLKRLYKVIGDNATPMDEYQLVVVEEQSESCGYIAPRYRWVNTNITTCVGYDLYAVEKEQVSYDRGTTWADYYVNGTLVTRTSQEPISVNVYECGYPMERWVETDETDCYEAAEYKWEAAPVSDYLCSGTSKYYKEYEYESTDGGDTWTPTGEYRYGSLIEEKSIDCGYDYKLILSDYSTEYTVEYYGNETNVTFVEGRVYSGYSDSIRTLTIGERVATLEANSLNCYNNLQLIRFKSANPPTLANDYVFSSSLACPIYVPCESVNTYKTAWPNWSSRITCGTPSSIKFRASYSDSSTYSLDCDLSTTLTTATTKPSGYDYSAMTSAEIGYCVNTIGQRAFYYCDSLSSCTISNGVISIGNQTFYRCSGLTSIDIPDSVTSIGSSAFTYCYSLSSCTIGSRVTSINEYTFQNCTGLTSIDIPNSVTSIGTYAFTGCYSLSSCTIGSGVTYIAESAFNACRSLTSIDIPNSVTRIFNDAFIGCGGLTSCTIGSGVTTIGNYAFYFCNSLQSITVRATTPPTLGSDVFKYTNDCPIYVPSNKVSAYKSAWSDYSDRIQAIP